MVSAPHSPLPVYTAPLISPTERGETVIIQEYSPMLRNHKVNLSSLVYIDDSNRSLCGRISRRCRQSKCLKMLYRCTIILPLLVKLATKIYNCITGQTPLTRREYCSLIRVQYAPHHKKIIEAVIQLTLFLSKRKRKAVIRHLAESIQNPGESLIIRDMSTLMFPDFKKFLAGAYILIPGKEYYDRWARIIDKRKRRSSHESDKGTFQYAIRGNFVKEALFGRITKRGITYTWIQLEKNPVSLTTPAGLKSSCFHMLDFCKYRWSGHNQGPYGTAVHTEKSPLHYYQASYSATMKSFPRSESLSGGSRRDSLKDSDIPLGEGDVLKEEYSEKRGPR